MNCSSGRRRGLRRQRVGAIRRGGCVPEHELQDLDHPLDDLADALALIEEGGDLREPDLEDVRFQPRFETRICGRTRPSAMRRPKTASARVSTRPVATPPAMPPAKAV